MGFLGLFFLPLGRFVLRNSVSLSGLFINCVFYVSCSWKAFQLFPVPHIEFQSVVFFPSIAVLKIAGMGGGREENGS